MPTHPQISRIHNSTYGNLCLNGAECQAVHCVQWKTNRIVPMHACSHPQQLRTHCWVGTIHESWNVPAEGPRTEHVGMQNDSASMDLTCVLSCLHGCDLFFLQSSSVLRFVQLDGHIFRFGWVRRENWNERTHRGHARCHFDRCLKLYWHFTQPEHNFWIF